MKGNLESADDVTDQELMRAYQDGDQLAFQEIYQRHSGRVYAFLKRRLAKREEIDEVFQQVFTKFHLSRSQYDSAHAVPQWLYVLTKTVLLDHWRKETRRLDHPFAGKDTVENMASLEAVESNFGRDKIHEALQVLAPEPRRAVEFRVFDELSYEEIAKKLGKTPINVRQMISRALKKMKTNSISEGGKIK